MAGYKYYTILTDIGKQKLVEAISNETPIDFAEIAVGDANGVSYNPTGEETALKHEVFKKAIDSVSIDSIDKNIMIFEMVVPASSGGYYMREAGLFASDGTLIAVARVAEQYKPLLEEGAGSSITISMRIAISSDAQVYINIPESINYATQNYVQEEFKKHKADENPHTQYVILKAYNEKVDELEQALISKADSNHRHDDLYSNINHTHTGYAASSHSHAFSAITGSMDITDSRLTGNLPVARVTGVATAPKHYTTSAGHWVETTLSDGTIMLQGSGNLNNQTLVQLPKRCSSGTIIINAGTLASVWATTMFMSGTQIAFIYNGVLVGKNTVENPFNLEVTNDFWGFIGILE